MAASLGPVQIRRLLARTLGLALGGGPAPAQLVERWADAESAEESWLAALTWDGIGATVGWALDALDLREVAPPEVDEVASEAFAVARAQAVRLSSDLARLGAGLEAHRVPAVALKGSALLVSNLAPALGVRWMSDIDLLVPEAAAEGAAWVAESLGFARGGRANDQLQAPQRPYRETFVGPEGHLLEVHRRLGPPRWGPAADGTRWFDRASPSTIRGILSPAACDLPRAAGAAARAA